MRITIATAVDGQHKDWDIDPEALNDGGRLEQSFAELSDYLNENDGQMDEERGYRRPVDSGGAICTQVWDALLTVAAFSDDPGNKRIFYKNLTLATGPDTDMDVQVKIDLDLA